MIPVEDPAGRTVSVSHNEAERAPHENTDQVADVERAADHKKVRVVKHVVRAQEDEVAFLSFTAIFLPIMIPPYEKDRTAVRSPVLNGSFVCL